LQHLFQRYNPADKKHYRREERAGDNAACQGCNKAVQEGFSLQRYDKYHIQDCTCHLLFFCLNGLPYKGIVSFNGDFIFFAYILALGKFFSIIGAMDTGSSFEGMGASREALFSMFAEPAYFILIGSFALLTGYTSFYDIFTSLHLGSSITYTLGALAAFVLLMIAMIENSRMPVDDPKTHLELTMVHEVMILDNSGFDLGLILTAGYLKFAMFGAIIAGFFMGGLPVTIALPLFLAIQFLFAVSVGLIESFMARFRMSHNAQFILALSSVSFLIFLGVLLVLEKFV
jgi:formate hydrogenlyase subunit 4